MTSIEYSNYFKTISNAELLSVLASKSQYPPFAIEAANDELIKRQLTEEEVQIAKQYLLAKQSEKERRIKNVQMLSGGVMTASHQIIDFFSLFHPQVSATERSIKLITIMFSVLYLYMVFSDFKLLALMIRDIPRFDSSSFFYFLPFVVIPLGTILFWSRKSMGWMLLAFFLTFTLAFILWTILRMVTIESSILAEHGNWLHTPSLFTYILQFTIFGGTLYALCKPDIRTVYRIGDKKTVVLIASSALLTFISISLFF